MLQKRKSRLAMAALCAVVTLAASYAGTANRTDVSTASAKQRLVTVHHDGQTQHYRTTETTVGATLKKAGVELGPADLVFPKTHVKVYNGMVVKIIRVKDETLTQNEQIAFSVRRKPTSQLRPGMTRVVSEGKRGLKRLTYKVRYVDGVEKRRELTGAEVVEKPAEKVVLIGDYGKGLASRGGFKSRKVLSMNASAYDPGPRSCGKYADGRTCTGMKAGYGVVAVDPRVIKLGTRLYVEGYGFAIAGDRGRAIKGHKIDLGYDTYREAINFGRRKVRVHILE